tara:strand:+ start:4118 stop:4390 length:273 start_codon:yes stop_codon:yes gene_type:complete
MTYDLSIYLPVETVEGLFIDCEDDHAATPTVARTNSVRFAIANTKRHNDMLDAFVEYKTPANLIRGYNSNKASQGKRACAEIDFQRRNKA